jgi:hypothetical protein
MSKKTHFFFLDIIINKNKKAKIAAVYAGMRVVEAYLHAFIFSELRAGDWTASLPGCFIPRESCPTLYFTGDWVGFVVGIKSLKTKILQYCGESNHKSPVFKLVAISNKRLPQKVKDF